MADIVILVWLAVMTGFLVFTSYRRRQQRPPKTVEELLQVADDIESYGSGFIHVTRVDPKTVMIRETR